MTDLERLALQLSARLSGDDLVLVHLYATALTKSVRIEALREAEDLLPRGAFAAGDELRRMIERERADG